MLVLTRKAGESIHIGESTVQVTRIDGNSVKLGIDAPRSVPIVRAELADEPRHVPAANPPRVGWNWWRGKGNDRTVDGTRPIAEKDWAVYVWLVATYENADAYFCASSANWVAPMRVDQMGGEWMGELRPPR